MVTPFVGVWIEIAAALAEFAAAVSLPSWECGLKFTTVTKFSPKGLVTPFVGVWIEILECRWWNWCRSVTPFVGVWIEIAQNHIHIAIILCHSLRGSVD